MKLNDQLPHSEIERIIDQQEHELDCLIQESHPSDQAAEGHQRTAAASVDSGLKKFIRFLRNCFTRH